MMFLLQEIPNNQPEDSSYFQYRQALTKKKIEFEIVTLKNNKLTFLNRDFTPKDINHEQHLQKIMAEPFVPLGSIAMKNLFANTKTNVFYKSLKSNNELFEIIPNSLWLNAGNATGLLKDLETNLPTIFFRPVNTDKIVNGQILTNHEFQQMKQSQNLKLHEETFSISPVQDIKSESRFFIVKNKIITSSNYTKDKVFDKSGSVSKKKTNFVQKILEQYPQIGSDFVIDVCELADGSICIVEFNDIQASGTYSASTEKLIMAFNKLQI